MYCKDCIHEAVCSALIEKGLPYNDGEYPAEAFCMAFQNKSEWISVEDRLPESTRMVLCYTPCDGYVFVGYYQKVDSPYWKSYWNIITAMRSTKKVTKKVTHWMPLPEPPKGE